MLSKSSAGQDVLRYYEVIQISVIMTRHWLSYDEWNSDHLVKCNEWYQEISIIPVSNIALLLAGLVIIKI